MSREHLEEEKVEEEINFKSFAQEAAEIMPSDKPTLQKYNGLVHKGIDRAIK
jgi:hypothetical protein